MKNIFLHSILSFIFLSLWGCNSCGNEERKYEVMKRYGGWEARADETRSRVESIRTRIPDLIHYEFDSVDHTIFDSEFPYWQEIHVYLGKDGIEHARLFPDTSKSRITEEFYFKEGELMFAAIEDKSPVKGSSDNNDPGQYFFIQNTLVLALDVQEKRKDITDKKVKLKGVDLLWESGEIKKIIAAKKLRL